MAMQQIFVNLPVKDLNRAVEFFTALGFKFNPEFTDHQATCMIVGDNIFVMLLVEDYFKTFSRKEIVDTSSNSEVILALSAETREQVDEMVNNAISAGGAAPNPPQDHGWMYQHGFQDPDGHIWEVLYMDPAGYNQNQLQTQTQPLTQTESQVLTS